MGPYSEDRQLRRAELISSIILNNANNPEVKSIWKKHLSSLAQNETEYYRRIATIYGDKKWNKSIGMQSLTL